MFAKRSTLRSIFSRDIFQVFESLRLQADEIGNIFLLLRQRIWFFVCYTVNLSVIFWILFRDVIKKVIVLFIIILFHRSCFETLLSAKQVQSRFQILFTKFLQTMTRLPSSWEFRLPATHKRNFADLRKYVVLSFMEHTKKWGTDDERSEKIQICRHSRRKKEWNEHIRVEFRIQDAWNVFPVVDCYRSPSAGAHIRIPVALRCKIKCTQFQDFERNCNEWEIELDTNYWYAFYPFQTQDGLFWRIQSKLQSPGVIEYKHIK